MLPSETESGSMAQTLRLAAAGAAWLAASVPLLAHHSFSAEFDLNAVVTLSGPVTTLEWTNPHTFVYIAVTTPDGRTERWRVEGGSPGQLESQGITRETIAIGAIVTIVGYRARDHSIKAWGRDITFADGSTRYMGSRKKPTIGPPPPLPWSPPRQFYFWAPPGAALAVGLFILWWRRPGKRRGHETR